jgi:quercetin dioxygenase-like cupin family protein
LAISISDSGQREGDIVMKLGATVALTVAVMTNVVAQQAPPSFDPNAIPVDKEPQHKVVFTNEAVRIVDARFPPGYVSLKHTHAVDNVAITIAPGSDDAAAVARIGRAGFSKGGYSHSVTNKGTSEQRFIDVEILTSGSIAPDSRQIPLHTLELENDKVRIYRVVLANGQSMAGHSHGHGWLSVAIKGGEAPGSYRWHPLGSTEALSNPGTSPLELVELEPK